MFDTIFGRKAKSEVETKAINTTYTGAVSTILPGFPSYSTLSSDSPTVLQYQRGYAAACINIISKSVGGLPFYLYRVENAETGKYIGKSVKVARPSSLDRAVGKAISRGDYTLAKIYEHPFLSLLESDTDMSSEETMAMITGYLLTIGNAYLKVTRDSRCNVIKLKLLMSEYMSVKYDTNYNITQWVYSPALSGYVTEYLTPDQVIHISRKVPGSVIVGRGILEDSMQTVSVGEEAKKFTYSLLKNHMTPTQNIIVKNAMKNETEAERIKNKLVDAFSGDNRGKSIVTFGEVEIKDAGTKMRDQTVLELCEYCNKDTAALFGVPMDLLDQSNSNRASIVAAKNNFLAMTVFPLASNICSQITKFIVKEYDNSFMFGFDTEEALDSDPEAQAGLYKVYVDAGIMTKNEARAKLGLEPLPEPTTSPESRPGQA